MYNFTTSKGDFLIVKNLSNINFNFINLGKIKDLSDKLIIDLIIDDPIGEKYFKTKFLSGYIDDSSYLYQNYNDLSDVCSSPIETLNSIINMLDNELDLLCRCYSNKCICKKPNSLNNYYIIKILK